MELSELAAYAREKYHIQEQRKWADFPGFSVLCDPNTGKWVALLMRQWDSETGMQIERCDLKCGIQSLSEYSKPYLAPPLRMQGSKWINIAFDNRTESEVVFRLFDRAVTSGEQRGFTISLDPVPKRTAEALPASSASVRQDRSKSASGPVYHDTPLPFSAGVPRPKKEAPPERLRQMRRLYEYGRESLEAKAKNFYRQGMFMQDYEDDAPWPGAFLCYFPTYHDLTTAQLRGYFSWRTRVRRGDFRPISASAAYLYIYELLNGIGASSPEEVLDKLQAFEKGYLDSGIGDNRMRQNIHRWMLEFAVLKGLPAQTAKHYADRSVLKTDTSLSILQDPQSYPDEEVFSAICVFCAKGLPESPVFANDPERGRHLFCEAWRIASARFSLQEKSLFTLCFGEKKIRRWYPLANAVYHHRNTPADTDYILDENRIYRCRGGVWQVEAYENLFFDKNRFQGFFRETDLLLRRYLKTGRYLKEKPENAWAVPYIKLAVEADRQALLEAARPKITIDLSGLDQIRRDALTTRDSLLTEEDLIEIYDTEETEDPSDLIRDTLPEDLLPGIPLNAVQIQILRAVMRGEPVQDLIRAEHLMPSLLADAVNEALFDEIGDTVLSCEGDCLSLVEEYREDIEQLFGGIDS